jgi:hypothetical protein
MTGRVGEILHMYTQFYVTETLLRSCHPDEGGNWLFHAKKQREQRNTKPIVEQQQAID